MNTLSWMLYLAGIAGNIAALLMIVAIVVGFLGGTILGISTVIAHTEGDDTSFVWPWTRRIMAIAIPCAILASLIPSQNTIYAIAASEMGETALKSETGSKAVQALNAWLDRQIEGEPEQ